MIFLASIAVSSAANQNLAAHSGASEDIYVCDDEDGFEGDKQALLHGFEFDELAYQDESEHSFEIYQPTSSNIDVDVDDDANINFETCEPIGTVSFSLSYKSHIIL